MQICKCCKVSVDKDVEFCPFCGYDPATDTISASFRRQNAISSQEAARKLREDSRRASGGIDPGVKKFAFIGLAVVIFSILYKYNFNLSGAVSGFKQSGHKAGITAGDLIPLQVEMKKGTGGDTGEDEIFNPATPLILQGVTWGGGGTVPQALINSMVYHVGDTIQGAKIIKISKKGVVVLYNSRSYLLPSFVSKYKKD
jgi:hypothetical protein